MITIKIKPREVLIAKMRMKEFDKQKTYNKFVCKNNYIGLLGEMVLDRWMDEEGIAHQWVPFIKPGTSEPDFIIGGKTIDLKCSSDANLWLTERTPHDIYISAQIMPTNDYLYVSGWLDQPSLRKAKYVTGRRVVRGSRTAYVISKARLNDLDKSFFFMLPMEGFLEGLDSSSLQLPQSAEKDLGVPKSFQLDLSFMGAE